MAQGLCYRCHVKFAPGHKCKFAKLSRIELTGRDQLEDVDWVNATTVGDSQETDNAEISFHAILGQSVDSTMKLQEKHKLPVEIVPTFGVQIGNGAIIHCNKVCRNLQIQLPASLNTIQANWKDMFIIFNWKEKRYKLQGMRSASSMG
ncbi:hypothetical protein KY285_031944 [Solanum tuberosum]|nr:hypothetical protein KY285_031944 [Solanum tuberosum]